MFNFNFNFNFNFLFILATTLVSSMSFATLDVGQFLNSEPKPISTDASLNSINSTKGTISANAGGRLTLALQNGVSITLEIQPASLIADTEITMVELKDLGTEDSDSERKSIGVQIYPEGLQLYKPALLHIKGHEDIDAKKIVPFQFNKNGESLTSSYFQLNSANEVTLFFWHFSGHGYVYNSRLEAKIYSSPTPNHRDNMSAITSYMKKTELIGDDIDFPKVKSDIVNFFNNKIYPHTQSFNTCQMAKDAIVDVGIFRRTVSLNFGEDFYDPMTTEQIHDLFNRSLALCNDETRRKCLQHKVSDVTQQWYEIRRLHLLMGEQIPYSEQEKELDLIDSQCMHFDFKMVTQVEPRIKIPFQKYTTKAEYHIHAPHGIGQLSVSPNSEIKYDKFELVNQETIKCKMKNLVLQNDSQDILRLDFMFNPKMVRGDIQLFINPGKPTAEYDQECIPAGGGSPQTNHFDPTPWFAGYFMLSHGAMSQFENEYFPAFGSFFITNWDVLGLDSLFAQKVYQRTFNNGLIFEDTQFQLIHKPQFK